MITEHPSDDDLIELAIDPSAGDPRLAHADACAACAGRVAAYRAELVAAHAALAPLEATPPVDPAVTRHIVAEVRSRLAAEAPPAPRPDWNLLLAPALYTLLAGAIVARRGLGHHGVALPLVAWVAAGLTVALSATPSARRAAVGATGLALLLVVLDDLAPGVDTLAAGVKCLKSEVAIGLAAGLTVGLRGARYREPARVAAVCGAGALAAQGAIMVTCQAHGGMAHGLLFHALGVTLASLVGVGVARGYDAVAARSPVG